MSAARTTVPAILAVLTMTLSGCVTGSAPDRPTATVTATSPVRTDATPGTVATGSATGTDATGAPVADPPEKYTVPSGGTYFVTPTRNIACGLGTSLAGCQVFKTTVIPPGADCDHGTMPRDQLSKGYLSENGGEITPSCFNQGVFSMAADQKTLPYGHSVTAGGMTCLSETKGVTCTRGSHGFFVSAQSFRRW